jgi:hypothetical protein
LDLSGGRLAEAADAERDREVHEGPHDPKGVRLDPKELVVLEPIEIGPVSDEHDPFMLEDVKESHADPRDHACDRALSADPL